MSDPQPKVLDLIFGRWRSQILYAGVKLGVFDALRNGPNKATVIAHELGLDPHLTYRLLRALGSLDLLSEDTERTFSLTEAGELLRFGSSANLTRGDVAGRRSGALCALEASGGNDS